MTRHEIAGATFAIISLSVAAPSTQAQPTIPCNERERVVAALSQQFSENEVGSGITPDGRLLEVFASPNGSWTIVLSLPSGQSCMIASGEDWDTQPTPARAMRRDS